jgi:homogentisate 1,2-dioxygenase
MKRIFDSDCPVLPRACLIIILYAFANSGCSMTKPPTETLANAEWVLRSASEARAPEFAPMDFRSAKQNLDNAKKAMTASRYEEARRFAESAQVDAELAQAKAETEMMVQAADELRKSVGAIRTEAERASRNSPAKE